MYSKCTLHVYAHVFFFRITSGGLWSRTPTPSNVGPALFKGDFSINERPKDTFLDMAVSYNLYTPCMLDLIGIISITAKILNYCTLFSFRDGLKVLLSLMVSILDDTGTRDHNKHCMYLGQY